MSAQPIVFQPPRPAATEAPVTSRSVRIRALLSRPRLVRELSEGAAPQGDAARALCASRLCAMRTRRSLAASLANVLEAAAEPMRGLTSSVRVAREDVLASGGSIEVLIRTLQGAPAVSPRGVALVDRLLRDGCSPLYVPAGDRKLEATLRQATLAL